MKRLPHVAMLLVAVALVAADKGEKKKEKSDFETIQGKWIVVESYHKGEKEGDEAVGEVFTFSGKKMIVSGGERFEASFEVRPDKRPRELDVIVTFGRRKEVRIKAIYELSGNMLRICLMNLEEVRPAAVGAAADDDRLLWVLKRVKGDGNGRIPADFLKTESAAWNEWLNGAIHVSWTRVPVKDVLADRFGPADFALTDEKVGDKPVTFDSKGRSRREVLWHLSKRYGFDLNWLRTDEPTSFLRTPETQVRKEGPGGFITMTQVRLSDYQRYRKLKEAGQIDNEKLFDGVVYYSVRISRHVPFENATALVFVTERYKARIPQKKGK